MGGALARHDGRQGAVARHRQPAQVHQHHRAAIAAERLVHLDAGAAFAGLVVQQQRAGQEPAVVLHPAQLHRCGLRLGQAEGLRTGRQLLVQQRLFFMHPLQLPPAQLAEHEDHQHGGDPADQACVLAHHDNAGKTRSDRHTRPALELRMNDSLKTLLVIAFLIVIVWNLGAGLYYLLVDRGQTKRTVNALTRRIAVSVALIVLVAIGIYSGWIKPHGVGG